MTQRPNDQMIQFDKGERMARYIGPVCRLCRREAMKLFLKGERCYTEKCAIEKRNFPPGQHGKTRKAKLAGYGLQLREKQKVKRIYGVLGISSVATSRRRSGRGASQVKHCCNCWSGVSTTSSIGLAWRHLGLRRGSSSATAISWSTGRRSTSRRYSVRQGDVITILGRSQKNPTIEHAMEEVKGRGIPTWLSFDAASNSARVTSIPTREQINLPVQEQLIVELNSK